MEDKKAPKAFKVDWSTYSLAVSSPLSEYGVSPAYIGTTTNPFKFQFGEFDKVISSGTPHVQVQMFKKDITPQEADLIRELAKINKVTVSLHGPTGLDFSMLPESAVRNEMKKQFETAVRLVVSPEEFKRNPEKAREKAKKALVNVHLGTIGSKLPVYEPEDQYGLGVKEYSPTYVLAGRDEKGNYEFLGHITGGRALEAFIHSKKESIINKLRDLREKFETGEITPEEYIKEKEKILNEAYDYSKRAVEFQLESAINDAYVNLKQARRMIASRFDNLLPIFRRLEDALKKGEIEKAEMLRKAIVDKLFYVSDRVGQRADVLKLFEFLDSAISNIKRLKSLKRDPNRVLSDEELKEEIKRLYGPIIDEITKDPTKYGIPKKFAEKGLEGIYEFKKELRDNLGIALGSELNVMTVKEFVSENAARKLAKALADFFEEKGTIPTFVIENGIPPTAEGDMDTVIETAKKVQKYFVEEVLKRRKKLEKKGIKIDKKSLEKLAKEQIGITIDTSHLWMWKNFGKTEEEIVNELKKALDSGLVKHFHAVDVIPGLGMELGHQHFVPGHGALDWKKIMDLVNKAREEGKVPEDMIFLLEPAHTIELLASMGSQEYQTLRAGYVWGISAYGGMYVEPEMYMATGMYPLETTYFPVGEQTSYFQPWWGGEKKGGR